MKKLIILGILTISIIGFGRENEESDRQNRYRKFQEISVSKDIPSDVVYDDDYFYEIKVNRRNDRNN